MVRVLDRVAAATEARWSNIGDGGQVEGRVQLNWVRLAGCGLTGGPLGPSGGPSLNIVTSRPIFKHQQPHADPDDIGLDASQFSQQLLPGFSAG